MFQVNSLFRMRQLLIISTLKIILIDFVKVLRISFNDAHLSIINSAFACKFSRKGAIKFANPLSPIRKIDFPYLCFEILATLQVAPF